MVSERLKQVILGELELEGFDLDGSMAPSDVPGWDSLSHIRVIDAIEAEFHLRFRSLEILRFRNVADLQSLIDRKLATRGASAG
jgi:acyl carrier protein